MPLPEIRNQLDLAKALVNTVIKAGIELQIARVPGLYVIALPTLGVRTTDFDLSEEKKDELYQVGYNVALAKLATTALANP